MSFLNRILARNIHSSAALFTSLNPTLRPIDARLSSLASNRLSKHAEGNFNFIPDKLERRYLSNAYHILTRHNAWDHFPETFPKHEWEVLRVFSASKLEPAIQEIGKNDGHTGGTLTYVLISMFRLKQVGWEAFVKERMENHSKP